MRDGLDGAAAGSGAVRDGSGLSAAPSSASSNPHRAVGPLAAAEKPSGWDGDALPAFICDIDESAGLRENSIVRIYCHGELALAHHRGGGFVNCPVCGKRVKVAA